MPLATSHHRGYYIENKIENLQLCFISFVLNNNLLLKTHTHTYTHQIISYLRGMIWRRTTVIIKYCVKENTPNWQSSLWASVNISNVNYRHFGMPKNKQIKNPEFVAHTTQPSVVTLGETINEDQADRIKDHILKDTSLSPSLPSSVTK